MSKDEKKTAGASYIIEFYQNVIFLNNTYANYYNAVLQFSKIESDGVTDLQKETFNNSLQQTRYICSNVYIMFSSMKDRLGVNDKLDNEIKNNYKFIKEKYVINPEELEKFVISMNKVLLSDIIQNLLENNKDIVDKVFNDDDK
jgi:hypothetical protein